jgi:biopolymer transport protein ExbD
MARRRYHSVEQDEPVTDIASLIDCSFLLLIYFLVTSSLQPPEADLGLNLPAQAAGSESVKLEPLNLRITAEGTVYHGTEALESDNSQRTLPRLKEELARFKEAARITSNEPIIILNADDAAPSQRFIDVINALGQMQLTNVTLAGFRD